MTQPSLALSFTPTYHKASYPAISPTQPKLSAQGKSIFITGGATGIGFAIAQAFVSADASHIALIGRRQDRLFEAKDKLLRLSTTSNTKLRAYAGSVADATFMKHVMKYFADVAGGKIDVLVSCAGQLLMHDSTLAASEEEIREIYDTNLFGGLNAVREFLALPYGGSDSNTVSKAERIIIDVSTAGIHLDAGGHSAYCSSKLAFTTMLRRIGAEAVASGEKLRVHSFHPGIVFTELAGAEDGRTGQEPWYDDVELPGAFAVWLASEEARFLNGKFVWANWNVEELMERRGETEGDERVLTMGLLAKEPLYPVVRRGVD